MNSTNKTTGKNKGKLPPNVFLALFIVITISMFGISGFFITKWENKGVEVATVGDVKVHSNYYSFYIRETKKSMEQENSLNTPKEKNTFWSSNSNIESARDTTSKKLQRYVYLTEKADEENIKITIEQKKSLDDEYNEKYAEYRGDVEDKFYIANFGMKNDAYKKVMESLYIIDNYKEIVMEKENISKEIFEDNISKEINSNSYKINLFDNISNKLEPDWQNN